MSGKKTFDRSPMATGSAIGLAAVLALGVGGAWAGLNVTDPTRGIAPLLDDEAIAALKLSPTQQVKLQQVRTRSGVVLDTVQAEMRVLRQRLDSELASDEPDLRQVFEQGVEARRQTVFAAIDQARELRLDLYDSLSAEQKRQVAGHIETRLKRFDRMRSLFGRLLLNKATF